ncbi:bifunctional protein-disulfide isomerase/oxidoreductase DsbC [Marinobacter nanhaiticus D15-8W]|uniref:Thiol:disulfide interchange protein n=1 Tax=Marinobacter nanhaiticus D15-8W TaxID=626887 RepID=N6W8Y5_9GAMM|nr:DsbC family protein [Marinobacter nanhaiticus]ENO16699.1 DsbC family protein [Marinobacter nanhaiticus D15-8W]BES72501.1 bifunctional protein-disulfide isomerase/oxidoreductase DsbC [Marinobacter nanhaiticus D15-8W]
MINTFKLRSLGMALALVGIFSSGAAHAAGDEAEDAIRDRLEQSIPGLEVQDVSVSRVDGLYEVTTNNPEMIYATENGEYFLVGDLYQVSEQGLSNVTEQGRAEARAKQMAKVDHDDMISFSPEGEVKAEIFVFTDIDCPYCRKLHQDVPRLNELGIQVNYLGYPRSGPGTPSFKKYVSVWCSEDSRAAMDKAKNGGSVPPTSCDNPVEEQFRLGGEVGVTGTPAIVLEDGNMIRGYVPADRLAQGLGLL